MDFGAGLTRKFGAWVQWHEARGLEHPASASHDRLVCTHPWCGNGGGAFDCATCRDKGYVDYVSSTAGRRSLLLQGCTVCGDPAAFAWERRQVGFPGRTWRRWQLSDLPTALADTCGEWLVELWELGVAARPFLTLCGGVGTGKTTAAVATARVLAERGQFCRFVTTSELLSRYKATFGRRDVTLEEVQRVVLLVDVLVLDDLGAEHRTGWAEEQLTALLDFRMREGRITIITTNEPAPRHRRASRLESRVYGSDHARVVIVAGADRRFGAQ